MKFSNLTLFEPAKDKAGVEVTSVIYGFNFTFLFFLFFL